MKPITFNGKQFQALEPSDEEAKKYIGKEVFVTPYEETNHLDFGILEIPDNEDGVFECCGGWYPYMLPVSAVIPQQEHETMELNELKIICNEAASKWFSEKVGGKLSEYLAEKLLPYTHPQQLPEPDWDVAPRFADVARNVLVFSVKDQEYDELNEEWSFDPCGTVDEKWKILGPIFERPQPKELTREEKRQQLEQKYPTGLWWELSDSSIDDAYEKMRTK